MRQEFAPRGTVNTGVPGMVLRPVVAMDIDGTSGMWHEHFLAFAAQYLGRELPATYEGLKPMHNEMGISKTTYRQVKLAYRQSGLKRAMPVRDGAVEMARAVRKAGAELWVCTTRPYLRLDNIDPDTREWLRRNRMPHDGVLFGENKYRDLRKLVGSWRVVAVLEDLPQQAMIAEALGMPSYLMLRGHNWHAVTTVPLLEDFAAATKQVLGNIAQWKERHGV